MSFMILLPSSFFSRSPYPFGIFPRCFVFVPLDFPSIFFPFLPFPCINKHEPLVFTASVFLLSFWKPLILEIPLIRFTNVKDFSFLKPLYLFFFHFPSLPPHRFFLPTPNRDFHNLSSSKDTRISLESINYFHLTFFYWHFQYIHKYKTRIRILIVKVKKPDALGNFLIRHFYFHL